MTRGLDAATALAYLRSLRTDVRMAALLGPRGELLAGDAGLDGSGRADLRVVEAGGHRLVVEPASDAAGPALEADMRAALEALGGR